MQRRLDQRLDEKLFCLYGKRICFIGIPPAAGHG
jgi:hypothetical protein